MPVKGKGTRKRVPRVPTADKPEKVIVKKKRTVLEWIRSTFVNYKTPLVLANVSQASQVGTYIYLTSPIDVYWFNLAVAVVSAFAFDLTVVATAFLPKRNRLDWAVSGVTSIAALVFSAAIAFELTEDILHIGSAVVVFCFSWLLALYSNHTKVETTKV